MHEQWVCACKTKYRVVPAVFSRFGCREQYWHYINNNINHGEWRDIPQPDTPATGERHLIVHPVTGKPYKPS
jgi:hypothetical protein